MHIRTCESETEDSTGLTLGDTRFIRVISRSPLAIKRMVIERPTISLFYDCAPKEVTISKMQHRWTSWVVTLVLVVMLRRLALVEM